MRHWLAALAISFCTIPVALGDALSIAERDWSIYERAHFRFITDMPEAQARSLLDRVVQFDQVAAALHEAVLPPNRAPLKVLVFRNRKDFAEVFQFDSFSGFTLPSLNEHTIALGPDQGGRHLGENTLHEYVHYILRQSPLAPLPLWYEEGYASLLATARFKNGKAIVGHPGKLRPPARLHVAQNPITVSSARKNMPLRIGPRKPFNLRAALRPGFPEQWPMQEIYAFYTSTWLLVHYLVLGQPEQRPQLASYLLNQPKGLLTPDQFAAQFGLTDEALQRTLSRYARRRSLPTTEIDLETSDEQTQARKLSPAEALFELGLASAPHNPAFAESAFAYLATLEDQKHRSLIGQAILKRGASKHSEAGVLALKALRHAPDNTAARTLLAGAMADACPNATSCRGEWRMAAQHYETALNLEPHRTDALLGLGAVQFRLGELESALTHLEAAYSRAPWSARINFFLGEAYRMAGRRAQARKHLYRAARWELNGSWKARAEKALDDLG